MDTGQICPGCLKPLPQDAPQGLCPACLMQAAFGTASGSGDPPIRNSAFIPLPVETVAQVFPQLEIVRLVGQGGMGAVYLARQPKLDRFVALKILAWSRESDPHFTERFSREARTLAR